MEIVRLLLRRGANISARDKRRNTCLHLFSCSRFAELEVERQGLSLLLDHGANISAKNYRGVSVSAEKYRRESRAFYIITHRQERYKPISRKGDVWDNILALRGYNIADFREGMPRVGQYSRYYTREDFEKMWKGNEHLCPYYNVPERVPYHFEDQDTVDNKVVSEQDSREVHHHDAEVQVNTSDNDLEKLLEMHEGLGLD